MTAPVRAVERAFSVLQVVAASPRSVTLAQITNATRLPKSSVSRMLLTLEHLELVEQVGPRGHYRIGPGLEVLAGRGTSPQVLKQLGRPHLEKLVTQLGEDAALTVPEGKKVLYISQVVADRTVQVQDWTGHTFPLHTLAPGQVCLSHWDPNPLQDYLREDLVRLTAHTMVDPTALQARLKNARRDGFVWADQESAVDVNGVAAPLTGPQGKVVAALSVHGPSYRFPGNRDRGQIGKLLKAAADQLSQELAAFPPGTALPLT